MRQVSASRSLHVRPRCPQAHVPQLQPARRAEGRPKCAIGLPWALVPAVPARQAARGARSPVRDDRDRLTRPHRARRTADTGDTAVGRARAAPPAPHGFDSTYNFTRPADRQCHSGQSTHYHQSNDSQRSTLANVFWSGTVQKTHYRFPARRSTPTVRDTIPSTSCA